MGRPGKTITVREYALLTSDVNAQASIDLGVVSSATFEWLIELNRTWRGQDKVLSIENQRYLKLGSYVGYLEAPNGEGIEVLPKTEYSQSAGCDELRRLLYRMLSVTMGLSHRVAQEAFLVGSKLPLHEWIMRQFINQLNLLTHKGLRFDYEPVECESLFIRGQLDFKKQLRQTPDRAMNFHIRTADFKPNRIENRLIKTALSYIHKVTKDNENWRQANRLSQVLSELEPLSTPLSYLPQWQDNKLLSQYKAIKPWCGLILERLNPNFQKGYRKGIACLFPMEVLYEKFVGYCLKKQVSPCFKLYSQKSFLSLALHQSKQAKTEKAFFSLQPDFIIESNEQIQVVLDTKWKLINQSNIKGKYDIKQPDFYQLFAYGQKYMGGKGDLVLIYPKHDQFDRPIPSFRLGDELVLWCIPFDLTNESLVWDTENEGDVWPQYAHYFG